MANTKLVLETQVKGANASAKEIKKLDTAVSGLKDRINKASGASKAFAAGMLAIAGGAAYLGKKALDAAADFEQSQISFTTMLGSAEEAEILLAKLAKFAAKTPFSLKGVEKTSKQLLAMGGATKKNMIPVLKALGDVSAGLSVPIERLAYNYGQVASQGKLTGKELKDFAIAGVPLIGQLAKQLGKSRTEIQKMVSAGKIGFDDVEQAFRDMSSEGGQFNDLMDKQSKSLNGMISNLGDAWELFLRGEGAALLDWGKKFIGFATHVVENILPKWIIFIKALSAEFQENKLALAILVGVIGGALIPVIWSAVAAAGALFVALAPFMLAGAAIAGLVAGIWWIATNWDKVKAKLSATWDKMSVGLKTWIRVTVGILTFGMSEVIGVLIKHKDAIIEAFVSGFRKAKETIVNILDAAAKRIASFVGYVKSAFESIKNPIGALLPGYTAAVQSAGKSFGEWVRGERADGGPVEAGSPYLVGENGPETFVPSRNGTIVPNGAGGVTINIQTMIGEESFAEQMGDMIVKRLAGNVFI